MFDAHRSRSELAIAAAAFVLVSYLWSSPHAPRLHLLDETSTNTIGRANLDGTATNQSFIAGADFRLTSSECEPPVLGKQFPMPDRPRQPRRNRGRPNFIRADLGDPLCYPPASRWAPATSTGRTMTRAVSTAPTSMARCRTGLHPPRARLRHSWRAVDANYIYWADGSLASDAPISTAPGERELHHRNKQSDRGRVDAGHVYWRTGFSGGGVGRANIDGTAVDESFITLGEPFLATLRSMLTTSIGRTRSRRDRNAPISTALV